MIVQRFCLIILACSIPVIVTNAQSAEVQDAPVPLSAGSSKTLTVPPLRAEAGPQCDASGNIYFHSGFSGKDSVIVKLDAKDSSPTVFKLTGTEFDGTYFVAFHVTVNDDLALLVSSPKNEPSVYSFNGKGAQSTAHTVLDLPAGINALTVQGFVVLPSGDILLQGYFDNKAPEDRRNKGYLADFSPSGKLRKLTFNEVTQNVLRGISGRAARTASAQLKDGTTYLLEADRIAVLSPSGELQREMKLVPPSDEFRPELLYMYGRRLIVGFFHSGGMNQPIAGARFELLDSETAEITRIYEPVPELGNNLVCFTDDGLIFMKKTRTDLKLIQAPVK